MIAYLEHVLKLFRMHARAFPFKICHTLGR